MNYNYIPYQIPLYNSIQLVAKILNTSCSNIFMSAVYDSRKVKYNQKDFESVKQFSEYACQTSNPAAFWIIAKVESNFTPRIIRINKLNKVLKNEEAESYAKSTHFMDNIDIGILQVNWKYNGKESGLSSTDFLNPYNSAFYITNNFIPKIYNDCKNNWINCYNSKNTIFGDIYRYKIDKENKNLRKILYYYLDTKKKRDRLLMFR